MKDTFIYFLITSSILKEDQVGKSSHSTIFVEKNNMKKLIIFDLDGTLVNTIADLAHSTNQALEQHGFPTHEVSEYKHFVGNGINKLFERALPEGERTTKNIAKIRKAFLAHYDSHNVDHSKPYPGIPELLNELQDKGIQVAVASNKYQAATRKLIAHFFPTILFTDVLGQREGINPKPDPGIVHEIVTQAGVSKKDVLYVGDSGVDMETAINSGVTSCGVTWGFRPRTELEQFQPDHIVEKAEDILRLISRA